MNRLTILSLVLLAQTASAAPIAVTRFDQQVEHIFEGCHGWVFQDQLRTVLEEALTAHGLEVLERQSIHQIHDDEYEMADLDPATKPRPKHLVAARYSISGGITELGVCESKSGGGVQLGGLVSLFGGPSMDLHVGGDKALSKVTVMAHLVSVETGRIIKTFTARAEQSHSSSSGGIGAFGVGMEAHHRESPPIERAVNAALGDLAAQIAQYMASAG